MIDPFKFMFLMLSCVILTGCTAMQDHQAPVIFTEQSLEQDEFLPNDNLDDLMRYHHILLEKNAFQLSWEYNYAKHHYKNNTDAISRLKYILLISLPNTAFTDIPVYIELVNSWNEDVIWTYILNNLKKFLTTWLSEQQVAKSNAKNFLQKLKASEEHTQTLQNRIDAIKNMEKNPIRRITP